MNKIMSIEINKQTKRLKDEMMDKIESAVDTYLEDLCIQSKNGTVMPTINQIEASLTDLRTKTRDISLDSVTQFISNFNESEMIVSKKGNMTQRG